MSVTDRFFTVSELWGPFTCEHEDNGSACGEEAFTLRLVAADVEKLNKALPDSVEDGMARGPEAVRFILKNHLGVVLCDKHLQP